MIANGFCNDETNNAGCYYDGGDCCGSCVLTHYCLDCKCLDPETNKHTVQNVLVGDGYCHDVTNKAECNFDGNDCCGFCINTEFCIECECHSNYNLSKYFHQIIYMFYVTLTNKWLFVLACNIFMQHWVGDGFCDDQTNSPDCYFDGGDCCGTDVNNLLCTTCECIGGGKTAPGPFCSCSDLSTDKKALGCKKMNKFLHSLMLHFSTN